MLKRTLTALVAALLTLPLLADLSLKTAELSDAHVTFVYDNALFKNTLLEKIGNEIQEKAAKENNDAKMAEVLRNLLPREITDSVKMVISFGGDLSAEALQSAKDDLSNVKFVGAASFNGSVKPFFDMIPALPAIKPEVGKNVDIAPAKIGDYAGYEITEKAGDKSKIALAISNDGKTVVFGPPAFLKECVKAEAGKYSPKMKSIVDAASKNNGCALAIALPAEIKAMLVEQFINENEMLDDATKAAFGKLDGFALTFASSASDVSFSVKGAFEDAASANAVKTALLDAMAVPMGQAMLPGLVGENFAFPKTIASLLDGSVTGLKVSLNETDCNLLVPMMTSFAEDALKKSAAEDAE
ncbi:MAG: hypothetical protein MJ106_03315 [Lentisphaeria bacterium]|nr:hypothetical protein [Lentisphaeria bacterium]